MVLEASFVEGNKLFLPRQLDRSLYVKVNKVLEAAGGKWTRSVQAHVFPVPAEDRVDEIILTGEVVVPKDEFDFFPTPPELAAKLVRMAEVAPGMIAYEPSAGDGAIVKALLDAGALVDANELNPTMAEKLLRDFPPLVSVSVRDFLTILPRPTVERIVMNPPFRKQADIRHVMHAFKFLAPGGILVSVMSSGVTFRENKLTREFLALGVEAKMEITPLPEGSFKSSGTGVNTVVVKLYAR